jgi:hypothetical protein
VQPWSGWNVPVVSKDVTVPHEFPFTVPESLTGLDDAALAALLGQVADYGRGLAAVETHTADTVAGLQASAQLAGEIAELRAGRAETVRAAAEATAAFTAAITPPEPDPAPAAPEPIDPPAPVTAAVRVPGVADVAAVRTTTPDLPADADTHLMTMTAAAEIPGYAVGGRLETFHDAARAVTARLAHYPSMTAGRAQTVEGRRAITAYDPDVPDRRLVMTQYDRRSAVQFNRNFPDALRVNDGNIGTAERVARHAASERRLPGGSLIASLRQATAAGRPITAAAGWCAPSDTMWDITGSELETLDGILDLPELQTSRGGWNIPANGGPLFATIWTGIGNAGTTHLTEAQVISDTTKYCWDIPCPDFVDVRLGVDYVCLTGGLLQRSGYPEVVERFSRGALVALAHKINQGVIAAIVTASGAATVIPADISGDDAISGLLAAVDLAVTDARYYARMGLTRTLEVVLPMWVLTQMRASGSRRSGDTALLGMTDAQIVEWFAIRGAVPRFVYDWQDASTGLVTGPGGAAPLTALPLTAQFLIYPAGTWVKAVQDVVSLDTIYDSTRLSTNEYTAVFSEDGWAALQMANPSRLYTAVVDPSGVVGCCPSAQS